jgi:hypothetical protein
MKGLTKEIYEADWNGNEAWEDLGERFMIKLIKF